MDEWFKLYGAAIGFFPEWEDFGWLHGTGSHASEILGYLMAGGGANYTFVMTSAAGVPVVPIMPTLVPQAPQPPGFPTIPTTPGAGYQWPWP